MRTDITYAPSAVDGIETLRLDSIQLDTDYPENCRARYEYDGHYNGDPSVMALSVLPSAVDGRESLRILVRPSWVGCRKEDESWDITQPDLEKLMNADSSKNPDLAALQTYLRDDNQPFMKPTATCRITIRTDEQSLIYDPSIRTLYNEGTFGIDVPFLNDENGKHLTVYPGDAIHLSKEQAKAFIDHCTECNVHDFRQYHTDRKFPLRLSPTAPDNRITFDRVRMSSYHYGKDGTVTASYELNNGPSRFQCMNVVKKPGDEVPSVYLSLFSDAELLGAGLSPSRSTRKLTPFEVDALMHQHDASPDLVALRDYLSGGEFPHPGRTADVYTSQYHLHRGYTDWRNETGLVISIQNLTDRRLSFGKNDDYPFEVDPGEDRTFDVDGRDLETVDAMLENEPGVATPTEELYAQCEDER